MQQKKRLDPAVTVKSKLASSPSVSQDNGEVDDEIESGASTSNNELQDQIARVGQLVQSHDLSDDSMSITGDNSTLNQMRRSYDQHRAESSALVASTATNSDLTSMSIREISQVVTSLQKDKRRLQKLVIAQQAAIESERQSHEQSRTVARDAVKIMRDARTAQKQAEKLAKRERLERLRLQTEYNKVARALNNAKSIINQRKQEIANKQSNPKDPT